MATAQTLLHVCRSCVGGKGHERARSPAARGASAFVQKPRQVVSQLLTFEGRGAAMAGGWQSDAAQAWCRALYGSDATFVPSTTESTASMSLRASFPAKSAAPPRSQSPLSQHQRMRQSTPRVAREAEEQQDETLHASHLDNGRPRWTHPKQTRETTAHLLPEPLPRTQHPSGSSHTPPSPPSPYANVLARLRREEQDLLAVLGPRSSVAETARLFDKHTSQHRL
eukprot:m.15771 g.15771  ORF g.15771 m.15771 type:complete len:225 (-) comp3459_c0_seq1:153-827(-)